MTRLCSAALLILPVAMMIFLVAPAIPAGAQVNFIPRVLSIHQSGSNIVETMMLGNGTVIAANITVSSSGSDPTYYWEGNSVSYPTYIGNPPYSWYTGIGNPPEFDVYLSPGAALNIQTGEAAIVALMAGAGIFAGPVGAAAAAVVGGLVALDYSSLYNGGHNPDNSLNIWIPADWYNLDISPLSLHYVTVATPSDWWAVTALGSYITGSR
jgi:hypothetical protein